MTQERRATIWINVLGIVVLPFASLIAGLWYVGQFGLRGAEILALLAGWVLTGLGITAGYHRLFTHRSWTAGRVVQAVLLVLGAAAWQNSAITWASAHRRHHRLDHDPARDPYGTTRGFWWSHIGWIIARGRPSTSGVPDLWASALCRWQHRWYWPIGVLCNVGVPLLLGLATGRVLGMLLFAGFLRVILVHHSTFLINSACHRWGSRKWDPDSTARDNWGVALLTFGEGYHNFHHAYPTDYRNGPRWYDYDPTKWLIWLLCWFHLGTMHRTGPRPLVGGPLGSTTAR